MVRRNPVRNCLVQVGAARHDRKIATGKLEGAAARLPRNAGDSMMRFVINSTAGVGGLFDVAAKAGYPNHDTDFGLTLALWGVGEGPYLFLPVLGPSNPRDAKVQLAESHGRVVGNEVWLFGLLIAAYSHSGVADGHPLTRDRKLLLNRKEIDRIVARLQQERLTLVPLAIYFKDGRAKLELGVGRGRKNYDKRQVVAARDAARDVDRSMAARRRG